MLGKFSDKNFTVSKAFKRDLSSRFGIQDDTISVLYDRAVKGKFNQLSMQEKHELFDRTGFKGVLTENQIDKFNYKKDRPLLLLTSTSYTPDEDIGLLVDALKLYSQSHNKNNQLPKIRLIVTGTGPLKKHFVQKFKEFN